MSPVRLMIDLWVQILYVGFEAGAPLTVKDVISQPTVNVKAVNVLSEPLVGLKTAIRL